MGWAYGQWLGREKVNLVQGTHCEEILTSFRSKTEGRVRGSLEMKGGKDKD
jgi:hypothetical protein